MRSRRALLFAAVAALAAMLFAQVSLAAAASEGVAPPCHEPTPNVCAVHCDNNDLAPDTPRIKLPAFAGAKVTIVPPVPRPSRIVPAHVDSLPAGPPSRILFRSFLI
jgi:hypothetical protein